MTEVHFFRVPSKLARELKRGKGVMVADALVRAEAGLAAIQESCQAALDAEVAAMIQEYGADAPDRETAGFEGLYRRGCTILDVIGAVPDTGLEGVASSLCDLVDACEQSGQWDWPSVDVHLDMITLFHQTGRALPM